MKLCSGIRITLLNRDWADIQNLNKVTHRYEDDSKYVYMSKLWKLQALLFITRVLIITGHFEVVCGVKPLYNAYYINSKLYTL